MKIASFVLSLLIGQLVFAVDIPAGDIRKIFISGNAANVEFSGDPKLKVFQINFGGEAQNIFELTNRDGIIEIRGTDLKNKDTFGKAGAGPRVITLRGPSRPVDLHLMQGKVTVTGWQESVFAVIQKGDFASKGGVGPLSVNLQKGQIDIQKHRGKVTIDTYGGNSVVKNVEGDLKLESFSGDSAIDGATGNLEVKVGTGSAKVTNSSGTFDFEAVKGTVSSQGFQGRVEGEVDEGTVHISIAKSADVRVKTQAGRVNVNGAEKVGAFVNASTQGGDIYGPSYIKVARDGVSKLLKGRLRGGDGKGGSIVVRSQEGSIFLK